MRGKEEDKEVKVWKRVSVHKGSEAIRRRSVQEYVFKRHWRSIVYSQDINVKVRAMDVRITTKRRFGKRASVIKGVKRLVNEAREDYLLSTTGLAERSSVHSANYVKVRARGGRSGDLKMASVQRESSDE